MHRATAGLLLLASGAVSAAPFLVCDPYPTTGQQPTEFVVTMSGIANPIISPAVDVTGGKALRLDLGPLNLTGSRTVTAKARNPWGESASSVPLAFTAGAPVAPGGLGLSAQ
ncbi:MAG: hypothetical protein MUC53_00110 [Candidatus Contendobacter sp.]|jgi:hypothetical protein|nr:hypothetical protein [Candidatus Contendobacter sp.]